MPYKHYHDTTVISSTPRIMASKKPSNRFAHWNMFPFMTAPRTKCYNAQLQSPLFRIPREIREQIFECYLLGDDRYHYDSETGKMPYQEPSIAPQQAVQLNFWLTCRIASEEMKNVMFPTLDFYAKSSMGDGSRYMECDSRAGRFECRKHSSALPCRLRC
jgi:hypothetical protein